MVTSDLFDETADKVLAENDGFEGSVVDNELMMESVSVVGKSVCSKAATTCVGAVGEPVDIKEVAAAALIPPIQQSNAIVESTAVAGDMALDGADPHKVRG